MTRIAERFAALRERQDVALVPFLTAGDPDMEATRDLIRELEARGADLVELGVPFSDPMADGPTLQRAAYRALRAGSSLPRVLELVAELRKHSSVPIVLFGYYNPFLRYGVERIAADAREAGVDGLLCVDLPPDEAGELKQWTDGADLDLIFLLAPTSTAARRRLVLRHARGFVYFVSVTGVTGARADLPEDLPRLVDRVKAATSLPVGVGFGVAEPRHAAEIARLADAVIVGSAIAQRIEQAPTPRAARQAAGEFVGALRRAMRER